MPDRENTSMNAMKAPSAHSSQAAALSYPCALQLLKRDHTVLPRSNLGDRGVRLALGALPTHVGG
jgi:hypothetical protein